MERSGKYWSSRYKLWAPSPAAIILRTEEEIISEVACKKETKSHCISMSYRMLLRWSSRGIWDKMVLQEMRHKATKLIFLQLQLYTFDAILPMNTHLAHQYDITSKHFMLVYFYMIL